MTTDPRQFAISDRDRPDLFSVLFRLGGGIGRGRYWIGIAVAIILMAAALGFAATAMSPTGGGAPLMAIPCFLTALWVHAAVTIKRLRDMGYSGRAYVAVAALVLILLYAGIEAIEVGGSVLLLMILALLAAPGLVAKRAGREDRTPSG